MKLKVCGLTKTKQIDELTSLNLDFLGFIFYDQSPRYVLPHLKLEEIFTIQHQGKVGVFVNETMNNIAEITEKSNLNLVQLHGDEDKDFIVGLKEMLRPEIKIIKAIRIGKGETGTENNIQEKISELSSIVNYFLFDTDSQAFGGSGQQFDWNMLNRLKIHLPYFLSGGISEENLNQISILDKKPFSLDINSMFEVGPGDKDTDRIKVFKEKIK